MIKEIEGGEPACAGIVSLQLPCGRRDPYGAVGQGANGSRFEIMRHVELLQPAGGDVVFEEIEVGDEPKGAPGIHLYTGDLRGKWGGQEAETFIGLIIFIQPLVRTCPKDMVVVHIQAADEIIADACLVLGVIPEYFERVAVEPVQPVLCAKPEEAFAILQAAEHGIIGEPVLYLVVPEIGGLAGCPRSEE